MEKDRKLQVISENRREDKDTGSAEGQVALLTERVNELTAHLEVHRHDELSRRGLLKLVGHRRRMLAYLGREDAQRYRTLIARLGLRK